MTVAKNAFVGLALNVRVRMLLKGAVNHTVQKSEDKTSKFVQHEYEYFHSTTVQAVRIHSLFWILLNSIALTHVRQPVVDHGGLREWAA